MKLCGCQNLSQWKHIHLTLHSQIIAMNEQEQKCLQASTKKAVYAEDQLSL